MYDNLDDLVGTGSAGNGFISAVAEDGGSRMPSAAERKPETMSRPKRLRDITPDDLSDAFRRATVKAAQDALGGGLTITGMSPTGKLVTVSEPIPASETKRRSPID